MKYPSADPENDSKKLADLVRFCMRAVAEGKVISAYSPKRSTIDDGVRPNLAQPSAQS